MVAIVVIGLVSLSLWQAKQLRGSVAEAGSPSLATGTTRYPGDQGVPLPRLEGPVLGGDTLLSLDDQLGHVVVINVWGSWCGPCRAEAPDLAAVSQQAKLRDVRFLGIDVRDEPTAALRFESRYGIAYPSFDDRDGRLLAQLGGIIPVSAVPSTLVVDAAGVIRARIIGRVERSTLRTLIAAAGDVQ